MVILSHFDVELFRTALPALRVVFVGHVARNVEAVAVIRQLTTLVYGTQWTLASAGNFESSDGVGNT